MVRLAMATPTERRALQCSSLVSVGKVLGLALALLSGLGSFHTTLNHDSSGRLHGGLFLRPAEAQTPSNRSETIYRPIPLQVGTSIQDSLSEKDIPTGKGSFARDYLIELEQGDQVAIDLLSERFDTVVTLMTPNGTTVGENDDGPDGGTNSLLFMRIPQTGSYVVRVQAFGQAKGGDFTLKLTLLEAMGQ